MKAFGFWVFLFMALGTALVFLTFTSSGSFAGSVFPACVESAMTSTNRKLKESSYYPIGNTKKKRDLGNINLEDYHPVDPAPSSKTAVKAGPIEHGTPLMPYIPQPTPPGHPKHGDSP